MASKLFWSFCGPRLLRILKNENAEGRDYIAGILESFPDKVLRTFHTTYGISLWISPLIGGILYKKGYFTPDGLSALFRLALSFAVVYGLAFFVRGLGRIANADYRNFQDVLTEAINRPSNQSKNELAGYDFEFWAWPVDFRWNEGSPMSSKRKGSIKSVPSKQRSQAIERSSIPCRILGYLAMHSFGRRMVYPGATSLMNFLLGNMLSTGRASLIEEKHGQRGKVLTEDGNDIDTMFVDRRGKFPNGETLVITFEGNAGFYEMGCSGTPLDLNYSVLGWNHPGFAGSSGVPFPDQEQKAVDAIMQYAIQRLKFEPENIALFAWSIGGYTAAWTAKTYPDIKFVVLDATFDDIVPLAIAKMPGSWKSLVTLSLRTYMDLNVAEQLMDYPGAVLLIRRTRDEIITTEAPVNQPPVVLSNRGNYLLIKLLQYRYPTIVDPETMDTIKEFLALTTVQQASLLQERGVDPAKCHNVFSKHVSEHGVHFPMSIEINDDSALKARLALFLVTMHMENFDSTHCTPLPGSFFHKPWLPAS